MDGGSVSWRVSWKARNPMFGYQHTASERAVHVLIDQRDCILRHRGLHYVTATLCTNTLAGFLGDEFLTNQSISK